MRITVIAALIAVTAVAMTAAPAGAGQKKDSVKGNGLNNPPNGNINKFHINVQSGPNGEEAKGKVKFTDPDSKRSFTAEATCLSVSGTQATIVAEFTKTKGHGDDFLANGVVIWVEDNGKKVHGQAPDEIRNAVMMVEDLPATCPPPMDPDRLELTKGDIRVEDN